MMKGFHIWKGCTKGNITDENFIISVLNNLPKNYDVILNGLDNCLVATRDNALTFNLICKKMNYWYKKLKAKKEHIVNDVSMPKNLAIKNILKMVMKNRKDVRKQKRMKTKKLTGYAIIVAEKLKADFNIFWISGLLAEVRNMHALKEQLTK